MNTPEEWRRRWAQRVQAELERLGWHIIHIDYKELT